MLILFILLLFQSYAMAQDGIVLVDPADHDTFQKTTTIVEIFKLSDKVSHLQDLQMRQDKLKKFQLDSTASYQKDITNTQSDIDAANQAVNNP